MIISIYFHSRKKLYSVTVNRKVIGHLPCVMLERARFIVNEKGRDRVRREKRKNVHAYIVGTLIHEAPPLKINGKVYYNPYLYDSFMSDNGPVHDARFVLCQVVCGKPLIYYVGTEDENHSHTENQGD